MSAKRCILWATVKVEVDNYNKTDLVSWICSLTIQFWQIELLTDTV